MLLVAQITDTHLFADDRKTIEQKTMFDCPTNQTFAAVIQTIAQLSPRPDLLLLTGDISQDDTIGSYDYARSLIEPLQIPTYWLPGNHDQNTEAIQKINHGCISAAKSFTQSNWKFILLDSTVNQQPYGELSNNQLQWFEQELQSNLARSNLPTLVAVHHQAIACGLDYMDQIGLRNAEAFFQIVDRYPQIKVVLSGHIHQEFAAERNGVHYLGTPSTCIQLKPNQTKIEIDDRPPGFRLLRLYPDGQMATEVVWVD